MFIKELDLIKCQFHKNRIAKFEIIKGERKFFVCSTCKDNFDSVYSKWEKTEKNRIEKFNQIVPKSNAKIDCVIAPKSGAKFSHENFKDFGKNPTESENNLGGDKFEYLLFGTRFLEENKKDFESVRTPDGESVKIYWDGNDGYVFSESLVWFRRVVDKNYKTICHINVKIGFSW